MATYTYYCFKYGIQTFYTQVNIDEDTELTALEDSTGYKLPIYTLENDVFIGPRDKYVKSYGLLADKTPYIDDGQGIYTYELGDIVETTKAPIASTETELLYPELPKTAVKVKKALLRLKDGSYVAPYTDIKGALDIGDIGQSLYVNEAEGLRRRLNGSIVDINDHTLPFFRKLKALKVQYPSLFCSEDRWHTISHSNYFGQCGKFVIEDKGAVRPNIITHGDLIQEGTTLGNFYSNANYFKIQNGIPFFDADKFELVFKIFVDTLKVPNVILGNYNDSPTGAGCVLRTEDNNTSAPANTLKLWGTTNNTSWTTSGFVTNVVLTEGWQYIKMVYDGANYIVSKSLDGKTWEDGAQCATAKFTNADEWCCSTGTTNTALFHLRGKIDLAESYINVNDTAYWKGLKEEEGKQPYIRLPKVCFTQGSLTLSKLGELSSEATRKLVAERKPTLADTRWYRWYSDGWLEQGGYFLNNGAANAAWTDYTVTLLKPYKDDLYNVNAISSYGANTDSPCVRAITPKGFTSRPYNDQGDAQWQTWGWGPVPTQADANIEKIGDPEYPYFIQIANGETTEAHIIRNDLQQNDPYTLFEYKKSQYNLNNPSWLLSAGQFNSKELYPTAYEALVAELDKTQIDKTVELPSGNKYTKHLHSIYYGTTVDKSKIKEVGTPEIDINGILHNPTQGKYVTIPIPSTAYSKSSKFTLTMKFQAQPDARIVTPRNETVAAHTNAFIFRTNTSMQLVGWISFDNKAWNVNGVIVAPDDTLVAGKWYYLRFSFDDTTGYKFELSEDGITYKTTWTNTSLSRFTPDAEYTTLGYDCPGATIGTSIDLNYFELKYTFDNEETIVNLLKTVPLVYDKTQLDVSNEAYNYRFIVDRENETFRLPIRVPNEELYGNKLYFYVGNTMQNASLVDIGRLTEEVATLKAREEKQYGFVKFPVTTLAQGANISRDLYIVGTGRPVMLSFSGDENPVAAGAWCNILLYRNDVLIARQQNVTGAASASNPFALNYLDTTIKAGERVKYTAQINQNSGSGVYGETDWYQTPQFLAYEI